MTPLDAVALLRRHRGMWPDWMTDAIVATNWYGQFVVIRWNTGLVLVSLVPKDLHQVYVAEVSDDLSDEENVRRILTAAEKGYQQQQRAGR